MMSILWSVLAYVLATNSRLLLLYSLWKKKETKKYLPQPTAINLTLICKELKSQKNKSIKTKNLFNRRNSYLFKLCVHIVYPTATTIAAQTIRVFRILIRKIARKIYRASLIVHSLYYYCYYYWYLSAINHLLLLYQPRHLFCVFSLPNAINYNNFYQSNQIKVNWIELKWIELHCNVNGIEWNWIESNRIE